MPALIPAFRGSDDASLVAAETGTVIVAEGCWLVDDKPVDGRPVDDRALDESFGVYASESWWSEGILT